MLLLLAACGSDEPANGGGAGNGATAGNGGTGGSDASAEVSSVGGAGGQAGVVSTGGASQDGAAGQASNVDAAPDAAASERVVGVTIDDVEPIDDIVDSLASLSVKPTARVVFDENVPAAYYQEPVAKLHAVSFVMGELLDSFYVKDYSQAAYEARASEYLAGLGNQVDVWEVGNEINGEWLGPTADVVAKMSAAYGLVRAQGAKTALTLYYNHDCWEQADHEMFKWAADNIPADMKQGLDRVLVSYYEDDCNGYQPDWPSVFQQLGDMFPSSQLGIGECGTTDATKKQEYVQRYYGMAIDHPRWIGGHFWWYFVQDMVPKSKPLWAVLDEVIAGP